MSIIKLTDVFMVLLLLSSVSVLAAGVEKSSYEASAEETAEVFSDEELYKRMFLLGRVHTLMTDERYSTVMAVNVYIVFFKPIQFLHYTNGEQITFLNQDRGIILRDVFLLGGFTVVLPCNKNSIAVINTTKGTMVVELFEDRMPNTTANFIRLATDGFYDGLVFHRVINNFVIQGGGYYPNGTLKESPYGPIDLEVHPEVRHLDGTIGMARTSDPNSATSQFFIDDGRQRQLEPGGVDSDGYAAFGRVVNGIEVVRAIAKVQTTTKYGSMENWPVEDVIIQQIRILRPATVTITDYVGDVCSFDYLTGETTIVTNSTEICVENLDIERATYIQQGMVYTVCLHVVGNIENRGTFRNDSNFTWYIDMVEYGFQMSTSEQDYFVSYCNRTGTLCYGAVVRNLTSEDFMVVAETLSFTFYLERPTEQYESLSVYAAYVKINFSHPASTFLYFIDIAPNPPLEISEIWAPNVGYVGETIQFNASVQPLTGLPPYSYLWEFGDQGTSTKLNPTHVYTDPGVYTYTFTVTDAAGNTANASGTITILVPDVAMGLFVFEEGSSPVQKSDLWSAVAMRQLMWWHPLDIIMFFSDTVSSHRR